MTVQHRNVLVVLAASLCASTTGAQSLEGPFRGSLVCGKLQPSAPMLRAPLDLIIRGNDVIFARPIFNANGRVIGNEIASGSLEPDGKLHVTATWEDGGWGFTGEYGGTLTPTGGALTGSESWHAPNGTTDTRSCTAALVAAHEVNPAAAPK
jgi:hypothetical protein